MSTIESLENEKDIKELTDLRQRVAELEKGIEERNRTIDTLQEDLKRVRASEADLQKLAATIESSQDFIAIADLEGHVSYVNETGRKMVGLDSMEQVSRTVIADYYTPEDNAFAREHIIPVVVKTGLWQGDFRFRHFKTGAPIPIHYSVFAIKDRITGEVIALGTVTRDITERKKAEEESEKLKDEIIRMQAAALMELSTPLIPITDEVVVMPLIGTVDTRRAEQVMETLLRGVVDHRAHTVILDITGVTTVDASVADALVRAAKAVQLLGARAILTGISAEVAQTLVGLEIDLAEMTTHGSLQSAVAWATSAGGRAPGSASRPARR